MSHETEEYSQYVCIINACFYCAIAYATKLKIVMEDMNDKSCNVLRMYELYVPGVNN